MRHFSLFILCLCCACLGRPTSMSAQRYQATLSHYSTDKGLASNAISYIVQDDYGYIWLATWNGLSRFDGFNFFTYQTGAASRVPHLHNRIMRLAVDHQQNIWLRMYDSRIFVLKRSIDKFINPFEGIKGNENFISTLHPMVTSGGDVLICIDGKGLYKMRMENDKINAQLITTGDLKVTSMAEGYQNDIWLGTNKGVHRMDISNLTIERKGFFLNENVSRLFSNGYNIYVGTESGKILSFSYGQEPITIFEGNEPITGLFVDSHGIIWFSNQKLGVNRLLPNTNDIKHFEQQVITPDYDSSGAYLNEVNGTVWVRMNRGGYGYYNRETDEMEYFHNDPSNSWNLSNTVNAVLELNEGVIWESTSRRGLEKLEILKKTIDRVKVNSNEGPSMLNEIRAMAYDQKRQLLVYANKQGIVYFKRDEQPALSISKDGSGKPLGRIYGICIDKAGNYWLSSKGDGVYKLSQQGDGYIVKQFRHTDSEWSLNDDKAYNSVEDADGNIWVATYGGGVNVITKNKNGQDIVLHYQNVMRNYPSNSHKKVRTMALDKEGNVWAGTTDGILIMSYKDKKISIEQLAPTENDPSKILMSNDIVCLALDRQGSMWVGTNGGGLAHTVGKDDEGHWLFENFGSKDGLPSEEIRSITFDERGNVWFATDHILCSYDISKQIFTTFSNLDGVDETWCSEGAAVCLPNGNILFGTVNGYYVVDKSKLVTATGNTLKLRITDFWLNDELQSPRLTNVFDYYVPERRKVSLKSHGDLISFRFASLNYQLQHRVHYQYMMEGYDQTWHNADRMRTATYSNLPTGHYTFKVKAFLLESPEKFDMRQIEVVVPPYFLLSSNAIWLYMFLIILSGIWLLLWKQKKMEKAEMMRLLRDGPRVTAQRHVDDELVSFLNEYLDIHYSDPVFTVEELITVSGMPKDKFEKRLHSCIGMSPMEYVIDFRLKKAIALLEESDISISDVAFQCGYTDPAAFNRHFKSKTGMLPSKFRDIHKSKTVENNEPSDIEEAVMMD